MKVYRWRSFREWRVSHQSCDDFDAELRASVRSTAHERNSTLSVLRLTLDLLEADQLDLPTAAAQLREQIDDAGRHVLNLQRAAREPSASDPSAGGREKA